MKDLEPISREELGDLLASLDIAESHFKNAPHGDAMLGISALNEVRMILGGMLPGGLYTHCETCELPIGCDDESASSEDGPTICGDCLGRYEADAA